MNALRRNTSADFSAIAADYDSSRFLPRSIVNDLVQRLLNIAVLHQGMAGLDAGCGTGCLTIPFGEAGICMTGLDISEKMLERARANAVSLPHVTFRHADVQRIHDFHVRYDFCVVSKLFQHVGSWECAAQNLTSLLRNPGLLILINERGAFRNSVRLKFSEIARANKFEFSYKGCSNIETVIDYFVALGFCVEDLPLPRIEWDFRISYDAAFGHLERKLFAEFWDLTSTQYRQVLTETRSWIDEQPSGGHTEEKMSPHLDVHLLRKLN
ncbi:MAG: methyltransferase domain-containing protein [Bdellovibrionales bacterium]|nr:methyltransferase domain-containing protein [Bdellovibrionales bacterium]